MAATATTPGAAATLAPNRRLWIIVSLLTLYIIWGTTYLAIRFALESYPPYLMMGLRFVAAGGGLFIYLRLRGAALPTLIQWRNAAVIGSLLFVGGMGSVAMAEQTVSSGLTATLIAIAPLWIALFSMIWGGRPSRLEWIGIALGIAGVALLTLEDNLQANPVGIALILFATISWSFGSIISRRLTLPDGAMANAAEMLMGGLVLMLIALVRSESVALPPTLNATAALLYLTIPGSLATMTAYHYLLRTVRPTLATSYAFVNPVIALLIGVLIGGEVLSGSVWFALPVILAGVACVMLGRGK